MKPVLLFLSLIGVIFLFAGAGATHAETFNIANGNVASLQSAITSANGNGQDDTIELAANGTYTLTNVTGSLPQIGPDSGHKLTIHGNGATLQRDTMVAPAFRIFTIQSGTNVAISGLTMANGFTSGHGGCIYVNTQETAASTLTIDKCTFNNNQGDYGGAIFNDGYNDPSFPAHTATLIVTNSTFNNNHGSQYGGAIWNESGGIVMNVSNCTFSGNSAARSAGAIQFDGSGGTATGSITNCTFTQNSAVNYGGAVDVDGAGGFQANGSATLTITNCTFDQNTATWGGGIAMDGSDFVGVGSSTGNALVNVDSCTFSGNFSTTLGDAIYLSETTSGTTVLQIGNSILASGDPDYNISTDNISGGTTTVISKGYNLSDDAGCGVSPCNDAGTAPGGLLNHVGDIRNTNPQLDPAGLKNNGGSTQTIALQSISPALDKGKRNTITLIGNDQRGEFRPFDDPNVANATGGDGSDIGAYEGDVRVVAQDRIVNDLRFTFTTILGHNYEIQSSPTPGSTGTWTSVTTTTPASPIAGTGGVVQLTVNGAFSVPGPIFYRVHQL